MENQNEGAAGRTLVTGAAGLIGSAIIWELNRRGYTDIIACDRLKENDQWRNLAPLKFHDYIEADQLAKFVFDPVRPSRTRLKEVETVFHMGAISSTGTRDAREVYVHNYNFTINLMRWGMREGTKVVYASSASTYGTECPAHDDRKTLEDLRPNNLYGWFKHRLDLYAQSEGWLRRAIGLKFFNVYGPNEHHKEGMQSLVFRGLDELKKKGRLTLFDPEDSGRDFIYVKDAASAAVHLATGNNAGIFNVGLGRTVTWLELAQVICRKAGDNTIPHEWQKRRIRWEPVPEKMVEAGYQTRTLANIDKLLATGWVPSFDGMPGVEDCLDNYVIPGKRLGE